MSEPPQPPTQVIVQAPSQGNGMGVAGFVISLIGFLSCGLISPLGIVFSAIGLRKEPRGLAIAGLILGLLGSIWLIVGGLACIAALLGVGAAAEAASEAARQAAEEAARQAAGATP